MTDSSKTFHKHAPSQKKAQEELIQRHIEMQMSYIKQK